MQRQPQRSPPLPSRGPACLLPAHLQTNMEYGCFNPLRDVVVPANVEGAGHLSYKAYKNKTSPYYNTALVNITLFFAGGSRQPACLAGGRGIGVPPGHSAASTTCVAGRAVGKQTDAASCCPITCLALGRRRRGAEPARVQWRCAARAAQAGRAFAGGRHPDSRGGHH